MEVGDVVIMSYLDTPEKHLFRIAKITETAFWPSGELYGPDFESYIGWDLLDSGLIRKRWKIIRNISKESRSHQLSPEDAVKFSTLIQRIDG